jgi:hypothetical protein
MNGLNKSVQIDPKFTWRDWQLYDMPDVSIVASDLNMTLKRAVNDGKTKLEVNWIMTKLMSVYRGFGATDSEPMYFLERVLNEIFGEDE